MAEVGTGTAGADGAAGGAAMKAVRLVVDEESHRVLRLAAADRGVSMARLVQEVVIEYLERVRAGWRGG